MWDLAYEFARSGKYDGWLNIEHELRSLGYSRARQLLDDLDVRQRLDKMCADATKRPPNA